VILPRLLCYCDFMWKEMKNCRVGGAETMRLPFDCPMDHVLDTPKWFENNLGVSVREPSFLRNERVPVGVNASIARVKISKPLNDAQVIEALKAYEAAPVIEIEDAVNAFCGFADHSTNVDFLSQTQGLLHYRRTPFCMMEGSNNAPLFSQCCYPRKPGDKFFPCIDGFEPPKALPACAM